MRLQLLIALPLLIVVGCGQPAPITSDVNATPPATPPEARPGSTSKFEPIEVKATEAKPEAEAKPTPEAKSTPETKPTPEAKPAEAKPAEAPKAAVNSAAAALVATVATQLVESVKEAGPAAQNTPMPYLWLPADSSLIKDEPVTITPPNGLPSLAARVPAANPLTKGKIELGKQLYFDPRVSKNGTVSCATCHNPAKGWTDNEPTSAGIDGQRGGRSAPTVLNTAYQPLQFWDGRAPSLEAQAQGPVQNPIEMGGQTYQEIIERLREIPGYVDQFKAVFGTDVTLDGFAKAIASFERTALSGNSAYDKYVKANSDDNAADLKALSDSAKRGMVLFGLRLNPDDEFKTDVVLKKANCTSCHIGFNFTDDKYHNLGIGFDSKDNKFADLGRFVIEPVGGKDLASTGAFKTPTVRDITKTFPYMHDGSLKTLEEVVEHYNKGGTPNPTLDKDMVVLKLTDQEKKDVVEFMKALDGDAKPVALPTLPPGKDGKTPDPAEALKLPTKKVALTDVIHISK